MTNTTAKMTKRDAFNEIIKLIELAQENGFEGFDFDTLTEKMQNELALLDKKNSAPRKPGEKQVANDALRAKILEAMAPNTYYSLDQLAALVPELAGAKPQRMSGLMRPITNDPDEGIVDRPVNKVIEKRKAMFILA